MSRLVESYDLDRKYDFFNDLFFDGELSKIDVSFNIVSKGADGEYFYSRKPPRIEINENLESGKETHIDSVLIHEMIHHYVYENGLNNRLSHDKTFKNKVDEINRISNNRYKVGYTEVSANIDREEDIDEISTYWLFALNSKQIAMKNLLRPIQIFSEAKFNFTEIMYRAEQIDYKNNHNIKFMYIVEVPINNNFIDEESPPIKNRIDIFAKGDYGYPSTHDKWLIEKMKQANNYKVIGKFDWNKDTFIKERVSMTSSTLREGALYIDFKALQDAFPALAKEYTNIFEGKRPKIEVITKDSYVFNPSVSDHMTDYYVNRIYVFFRDGEIVNIFDASEGVKPKKTADIALKEEDAIMICDFGYYKHCELIVNPAFMNPQQITGKTDLSIPEIYALLVINSIASGYRKEYLSQPIMKLKYSGVSNYRNFKPSENDFKADMKEIAPNIKTYYEGFTDYIFPMLEDKGLVKINAKGSVQVTLDGKNQAEQYR